MKRTAQVGSCIEQVDYRIRITGVSPSDATEALKQSGVTHLRQNRQALVRFRDNACLIRFIRDVQPEVVENSMAALRHMLCPCFNDQLLQEFEADARRESAAA
jgi:hypothetical protein